MKKNVKLQLACLSLAGGILFSSVSSYGAVLPSEKNHWAIESMERLVAEGVFKGYEDGSFKPDRPISKAEFISMVNNMYGFKEQAASPVSLDQPKAWYEDDIRRAEKKDYLGLISGQDFRPNENISRQEAVAVLGYLLDLKDTRPANLKDRQAVDPKLLPYVNAFANSNFITGYQDGSFRPKDGLSRGEMASLSSKAVSKIYNKPGSYQDEIKGNVIINSQGVKLINSKIQGNIYIGGDLGSNSVSIENTQLTGELLVHSDNPNLLNLKNTNIGEISLVKDAKVTRLKTEELAQDRADATKATLAKKPKEEGKKSSSSSSSSGSSSRDKDKKPNINQKPDPSPRPNIQSAIINRQASQLLYIEGLVYGVIVLDQGDIDSYDFYIDGSLVKPEKVNTRGTILKYELNKNTRVELRVENSRLKDSLILDIK